MRTGSVATAGGSGTVLAADGLAVDFPVQGGQALRAVDHVSFELRAGEVLGIVGESGSGKTTLGRVAAGFLNPSDGRMLYPPDGPPTRPGDSELRPRARRRPRGHRDVQMLFQESAAALNPRLPVWRLIGEALRPGTVTLRPGGRTTTALRREVAAGLERVGLPTGSFLDKRPAQLSGGEKQRVAIARALAASPAVLVCDESVSALDVSVRAVVLNLFRTLSEQDGIALLFISHDISVVAHLADHIAVMHRGRVVEYGTPRQVIDHPEADYTRRLIAAVPTLERTASLSRRDMKIRRPWLRRRWFGLAAAVIAAALVLAACTSGSSGTAAGPASSGGKSTSGTIKIGSTYPPGTLDPATSTSGADYGYLYFVFDRLIQRNPQTGALEPMLATSWNFAGPGKLELDVHLRHGVKFQDGTPLNAQAVVYYSKAYVAGGDAGNDLQFVTSVTADGPYTVIYHLSQQNAQLPSGLADRAGMIASPTAMAKEGKSFGTHPVGTGPYEFVSEVQGASYDFTRFSGYWNNAAQPRVQDVDFTIFQSDTSLVDAIRSGDVNIASLLYPQDVTTLKGLPGLDVSVGPSESFNLAYFNGSRAPLNSPLIRLAFNLALNRQAITNAATDGIGKVWTQAQPPGTLGYVKSLDPVWTYAPAKAKQLVTEAGYAHGANLSCYEYPGLGYEITAPIIIAEEKAVGINLTVVPGTAAAVAPFFTGKPGPQCYLADGSGGGNPFYAYLGLWSKAYYNAGKTDFGVDSDYDQLYTSYTTAQEQQIFYDINKVEKTNPGYAILYGDTEVNAYQSNIGGWITSPLGLDNWEALYFKG